MVKMSQILKITCTESVDQGALVTQALHWQFSIARKTKKPSGRLLNTTKC